MPAINRFIDWIRRGYGRSLNYLTRFKGIVVLLFIASLGLTWWLYLRVPTAFLPDEDQGRFFVIIQGPQGVSLNYTSKVMSQIEKEILQMPEVLSTFAIGGFSFSGNTANNGVIFTNLTPWEERHEPAQSAAALMKKLRERLSGITEARVLATNPPAIQGLGSIGGFQFELEDKREKR